MTPSWYDVLGVDQDATPDEIRSTWRASVADLDPADRRFKQRNRAAEVLLDPERRAAHDAELALEDDDEDAVDAAAPVSAEAPTLVKPTAKSDPRSTPTSTPKPARKPAADGAEPTSAVTPSAPASGAGRRGVPTAVLAVLGILALLMVVASIVSLANGGRADTGDAGTGSGLPDEREIAAARAAAEAAIVPVLSYDYRDLERSRQDALAYLTPAYSEEYLANFAATVEPNAPTSKTVVTADVITSGIVRTGVDRVDVLIFVNRPTVNVAREDTSRDQVTVRMVDVDGEWLVGCLIVMPGTPCDA